MNHGFKHQKQTYGFEFRSLSKVRYSLGFSFSWKIAFQSLGFQLSWLQYGSQTYLSLHEIKSHDRFHEISICVFFMSCGVRNWKLPKNISNSKIWLCWLIWSRDCKTVGCVFTMSIFSLWRIYSGDIPFLDGSVGASTPWGGILAQRGDRSQTIPYRQYVYSSWKTHSN